MSRRDPWRVVALALGLLLFAVIVLPQLRLLRASIVDEAGRLTLAHFQRFLVGARYREALANTALVGLVSTVLALVVGVPIGFAYARLRLPFRTAVLTLATLSTVSPPFLGAYVWMMLLGWSGPVARALRAAGLPFESILGLHGIVWVTVWSSVGLVILFAHDAFAAADPALEEAAQSVGANRWRALLRITLPLAAPGVLTAAYLILMAVLTDFGTPKIVGGDVPMLPVLVYHDYLAEVSGHPSMAATASLALLALSTLLLMLQRLFLARRSYALASARRASPQPVSRGVAALVSAATGVVLGLVFVPHLGVFALSFATWRADVPGRPLTLGNYASLLERSASPIVVSYLLATGATVIAVALGAVLAFVVVRRSYRFLSPALAALVMVPFLIPGTVLAVGLIVAFNRPPLLLTGTPFILVLAYVIRKLPYALKAAEAGLYQVHPSLEEAALSVGAGPGRAFRDVTVPLIVPSLVSGGALTFLMSVTELSSTILLYSAAWTTMSVVIFQAALGLGGQFGLAAATAVVLIVSVFLPVHLIRRRFGTGAGLVA